MTLGFQMFLLAAEEMSFSRAAERAFVTQQCLSDHIRRLEETYHVTLFQRRPKLKLTPEGMAMKRYVSQMQLLEEGMVKELSDINAGVRGTVTFGIGATRGAILLPKLLPMFRNRFPNADVKVILNDTHRLEDLLLNGKLDLFLGVSPCHNPLFVHTTVSEEQLYLVIPDALLLNILGEHAPKALVRFREGVELKELSNIPFVMGHDNSRTTLGVLQYFAKHNLDFLSPVRVSDFNIHLALCRTGQYATAAPFLHLYQMLPMMQSTSGKFSGISSSQPASQEELHVFPLLHIDQKYQIELITHRDSPDLTLISSFAQMVKQCYQDCSTEINLYLAQVQSLL